MNNQSLYGIFEANGQTIGYKPISTYKSFSEALQALTNKAKTIPEAKNIFELGLVIKEINPYPNK